MISAAIHPGAIAQASVQILHHTPAAEARTWGEPESESLAAILRSNLEQHRSLVIDLSFNLDKSNPGHIDIMVGNAMKLAASSVRRDHRVVILMDREIDPSDEIYLARSNTAWQPVAFVLNTTSGEFDATGVTWTPKKNLGVVGVTSPDDYRDVLEERLVRRRGAFCEPTDTTIDLFRFSAENSKDEVGTLLEMYLRAQKAGAVVFDSLAEEWLVTTIEAQAIDTGLQRAIPTHELRTAAANPGSALYSALKKEITGKTVVVVLAMFRSGSRAAAAVSDVVALGGVARIFTLMAKPSGNSRKQEGYLRSSRNVAGVDTTVDYLVEVDHAAEPATSWQAQSIEFSARQQNPLEDWSKPSQVGMLSLIAALGTELERPVPRTRPAVRFFPRIRLAEVPDALWLAESLVRTAERMPGKQRVLRSSITVIMPRETDEGGQSGGGPIGEALKSQLDVAVLQVPRQVIEGKEPIDPALKRDIEASSSRRIVLLDESAITYQTLRKMNAIVSTYATEPALALAVIESDGPWARDRPKNLTSFFRLASNALMVPIDEGATVAG